MTMSSISGVVVVAFQPRRVIINDGRRLDGAPVVPRARAARRAAEADDTVPRWRSWCSPRLVFVVNLRQGTATKTI